jgi:diguanylate cyclase (GGDEF)-like protein/PAS domain S-box-containing protein
LNNEEIVFDKIQSTILDNFALKEFNISKRNNDYRRFIAINIVFIFAIIIFTFFAIYNFFSGVINLAIFDGVFLVLSLFALLMLYKTKNIELFSNISAGFVFVSIVGSLSISHGTNYMIFYAILYPLLSMLLLGKNRGLYTTFGLFIVIDIIVWPYIDVNIAFSEYLRFVMIFFLVTLILYLYENTVLTMLTKLNDYIKIMDENIISSTTDTRGIITSVSKEFCRISGYNANELIGKPHNIVRHSDVDSDIFKEMWSMIQQDQTWQGEVKNLKKDGGFYWVHATVSPMYDESGIKIGYSSVRQNITDKKIIEEISITDALTNIFNRRHFNVIFPRIINSAKRKNELLSFIIMDIDHFKQYNDTYGHQKGDDALVEVAKRINESLNRADDYCFRLGGEEFGVIFKADDVEKAKQFAQVIKDNIEALQIEHSGNSASKYVTVSMGLYCKEAQEVDGVSQIYKEADELLYQAKKSGKNQISCNA